MFDKLVESDTAGAEFKNRSRYFMVSSVVVGILFLTAVVYSLYAAEVGLNSSSFDIAELLAPVSSDAHEPEPPAPRPELNQASSPRNVNSDITTLDDLRHVPSLENSGENATPSRGIEKFDNLMPVSLGDSGPGSHGSGILTRTGSATYNEPEADETETPASEPPPVKPKTATIIRTSKVMNGSAIHLPKPVYPRTAQALNLEGTVKVQITIDEKGNVISAKAAEGHLFFREASERAAQAAKFKPTTLNGSPVKVTGIIVYNFKRN